MSTLRVKQKEKRISAILAAAGEEFRSVGFNEAKVEAIAARAEVAPATIYNYFGDKAALLLEILREHSRETRTVVAAIAFNPPDNPLQAIDRYFAAVFTESMRGLSRELWCEAYAASYTAPTANLGGIVAELDAELFDEMRRLFGILQERGTLGDAISASDLAELGLAIGNQQWSRFLTGQVDLEGARTEAIRQIRIFLDGAAGRPMSSNSRPDKTTKLTTSKNKGN
ncbi:TetR/AcrR family transcriptional regulator [Mesorhizobium sp. IMUNJ 23033]|uniref:TetR/AcrR family transcriptional regulator n=1 Tax=Mesorhizobium sp. IMUNJ 23033 TaxID=3378039 RepID=UPI00384D1A09